VFKSRGASTKVRAAPWHVNDSRNGGAVVLVFCEGHCSLPRCPNLPFARPAMTTRPSTSKPRGKCSFYNTTRGCFNSRTCKFLHDDQTLTSYDQAKTCRFYAAGARTVRNEGACPDAGYRLLQAKRRLLVQTRPADV
jgi:hypothetical protein